MGRRSTHGERTIHDEREPLATVRARPGSGAGTASCVRCLPLASEWNASRTRHNPGRVLRQCGHLGLGTTSPAIFDNNGVPVWWAPKTSTLLAEPVTPKLAWTKTDNTAAEDGLLRTAPSCALTTFGQILRPTCVAARQRRLVMVTNVTARRRRLRRLLVQSGRRRPRDPDSSRPRATWCGRGMPPCTAPFTRGNGSAMACPGLVFSPYETRSTGTQIRGGTRHRDSGSVTSTPSTPSTKRRANWKRAARPRPDLTGVDDPVFTGGQPLRRHARRPPVRRRRRDALRQRIRTRPHTVPCAPDRRGRRHRHHGRAAERPRPSCPPRSAAGVPAGSTAATGSLGGVARTR